MDEDEKVQAIQVIQKVFNAKVSRDKVNALRHDEMVFLGMAPKTYENQEEERRS